MNFKELKDILASSPLTYLEQWLPGGKLVGREYEVGSLAGEPGSSLKINVQTLVWADFATGDKGSDLISLYAAVQGIGQREAALSIVKSYGLGLSEDRALSKQPPKIAGSRPTDFQGSMRAQPINQEQPSQESIVELIEDVFSIPPEGNIPDFKHRYLGNPTCVYTYLTKSGEVAYYIVRYELEGEKEFRPYSWDGKKWKTKAWTSNRLLYNLPQVCAKEVVIIVEGEKAADALTSILPDSLAATTIQQGANGVDKADLSPLHGKRILIWPDHDQSDNKGNNPGMTYANHIAEGLHGNCQSIKILDPKQFPLKYDAYDFVKDGKTWQDLSLIIKSSSYQYHVEAKPLPEIVDQIAPVSSNAPLVEIQLTEKGAPLANENNCIAIIQSDPYFENGIWYDTFKYNIYVMWGDSDRPCELSDTHITEALVYIQSKKGMRNAKKTHVRDAIEFIAYKNKRSCVKAWLESIQWDGVGRIEEFFIKSIGHKDTPYIRQVAKNFLISMVARVMKPGCKVDNMIILEGAQGKIKSTYLSLIASDEWFAEAGEDVGSKDFYEVLKGNLIVEIAELDAFGKKDANTIKRVVSCRVDRYRPPYGRYPENFPRQCVFAGTTNNKEYLKDPTGARRFYPIEVKAIDVDHIKEFRDQYFAEALSLFKKGEPWWITPPDAEAIQSKRFESDEWEAVVKEFIENPANLHRHGDINGIDRVSVSSASIYNYLEIPVDRWDQRSGRRLRQIMIRLGWEKIRIKKDGHLFYGWRKL